MRDKKNVNAESEEIIISPAEYFEKLKGGIKSDTPESLKNVYSAAMSTMKKYMITGQTAAAQHLYNICELITKELKVLEYGFDRYIYREDIDEFIDKIDGKPVVIIELENYDRELPDEVINRLIVAKENNLFDDYYVIFTDYTGEKRKAIKKERREKDPILLANIRMEGNVSEKMYYIGDWVDEYCDLTLDKMVEVMAKEGKNIVHEIDTVKSLEEAKELLKNYGKKK